MLHIQLEHKFKDIGRVTKVTRVSVQMRQVLNSSTFKSHILDMDKRGELSKWKDVSNMEIYLHFMSGLDQYEEGKPDGVMNTYVDKFYSRRGIVGYTRANTKWMWVNTRIFDNNHDMYVGSNISHEYGHNIGFSHDRRSTGRRPFSICYRINSAYEAAFRALFPTNLPVAITRYIPWYKRILRSLMFWR